ncbi:MAG: hypothetical protein ACC657_14985 [Thiohalomonadales bacterium]
MITILSSKIKSLILLTVLLFGTYSCGGGDDNEINRNIENLVTIKQGIYGQATQISDVVNTPDSYNIGFSFELYNIVPSSDPNDGVLPIKTTRTDKNGFYEFEMIVGKYCLCSSRSDCISINLTENTLLRINHVIFFGNGSGWRYDVNNKSIKSQCI